MTVEVNRDQVVAYRVAAQGLHREATKVSELAVLDIGVQDSGADSARLAFDARLADVPAGVAIGPGEPLALVWSLRGAPYVHRRKDLNGLAAALWPMSEADAVARLDAAASVRKAGMSVLDAYALTVDALVDAVHAPMGKGAASTAVTELVPRPLTRDCRACKARHVFELPFRIGSLPAGLELEPETSPPVLLPRVRAKRVTGFDAVPLRRLATSYLRVLGPAGPAEVAGYLEARRAEVAQHWPTGLAEVRVDGRSAFVPHDSLALLENPPEPAVVRLLGPFDPYLQARDRDLLVPDRGLHKALWPVLGRPGVVLVDGEVAGIWRPRSSGRKLTVAVTAFAPLPSSVWDAIESEAGRVAQVRDAATAVVTRTE
jgi:hypothetical protein